MPKKYGDILNLLLFVALEFIQRAFGERIFRFFQLPLRFA